MPYDNLWEEKRQRLLLMVGRYDIPLWDNQCGREEQRDRWRAFSMSILQVHPVCQSDRNPACPVQRRGSQPRPKGQFDFSRQP